MRTFSRVLIRTDSRDRLGYGWAALHPANSLLDMYDWRLMLSVVSEDPTRHGAAGDCVTVEVTFDSTHGAGTYTGTLRIDSNDILTVVKCRYPDRGRPADRRRLYLHAAATWITRLTFNGTATALLPVDYAGALATRLCAARTDPRYAAAGLHRDHDATQCGYSVVTRHRHRRTLLVAADREL